MSEVMRNRVLAFFAVYAEGGTAREARDACGITGTDFYKTLRQNPDLDELYREIQRNRADMMVDEAYALSTDTSILPQAARERSAIRVKIAGLYDRKRFGDKIAVEVETGPSLTLAIEAARRRADAALQPPCDLGATIDADFRMIEPPNARDATDCQSAAPLKSAALRPSNPFED